MEILLVLLKEVEKMGAYLVLYFICLVLTLLFFFLSKNNKRKKYDSLSVFFMILMMFFLVFALYTKDPIDELITTIPVFWQFVITSLGGAFAIWKVYLNPLKLKVFSLDREIGEIKTDCNSIKSDISYIKDKLN